MFDWLRGLFVVKTPLPVIKSMYHEEIAALLASDIDERVYLDSGQIATIIYSIEEYVGWLDKLLHALHEDIVFPNMVFKVASVCRCNFYRNKKGGPTNVRYYHQLFIEKAVAVLKRHEEVLLMDARSKYLEATLYRSQALIYNLLSIAKQL